MTQEQRCWVHKTANVLNKLPKSQQPKAKRSLQEIWMAETRAETVVAFDAFIENYRLKYEKASDCLAKDREVLLAFDDFPAEHWKHLRTWNPIESTFATCATARSARKAACRMPPRSPWSSSSSTLRRNPGAASTATTSCLRSCWVEVQRRAGGRQPHRLSAQSRRLNPQAVTKIWR